jgi:hypothetical protein
VALLDGCRVFELTAAGLLPTFTAFPLSTFAVTKPDAKIQRKIDLLHFFPPLFPSASCIKLWNTIFHLPPFLWSASPQPLFVVLFPTPFHHFRNTLFLHSGSAQQGLFIAFRSLPKLNNHKSVFAITR